jgi:DNA-binding NarL/FixJ family response regulator
MLETAPLGSRATKGVFVERRPTLIKPRVLLADDHPALLKVTAALLKPQFDIVATVADGATLVSEALRLCPDVIVADITLPILSGVDAVHQLRESALSARIVFLTVYSEQQFIEACIAEGALGYVLKSHMKAHLIPAIQAAIAGQSYICPSVST